MTRILLLCCNEKKVWSAYLNGLPAAIQDVYFNPEYYENNGDGKARSFVFEEGDNLAIYPFLVNRINDLGYSLDKSYNDIQGAYGYNGVLSSSNDKIFIKNFYSEFHKYCIDNNIIAEFTRFNPLIENEKFSTGYLEIIYNRPCVFIDLHDDYNLLYNNFLHSLKLNLKKAKENNLTVSIYQNEFPYKKNFIQMYNDTMKRVNAASYLFFNEKYFDSTFNKLPLIHFVVFNDKIPVASAVCLGHKNYLHIHFVASQEEYWPLRPNDFLINEIIKYGGGNGYLKILFGGGITNCEEDTLLRFKKKFSPKRTNFYIGKKIHNEKIYTNVCAQWREKYKCLTNKYEHYILKYRFWDDINIIQENNKLHIK